MRQFSPKVLNRVFRRLLSRGAGTPPPSQLLRRLVTNRVERSYLRRDGWWADLILDEFDFVNDYGYLLAEVTLHFRGNAIRFTGPNGELTFTYAPEDGGWFAAELRTGVPDDQAGASLDTLLNASEQRSRRRSDDPGEIAAVIRRWATALRQQAPRLLSVSSLG